MITKTITLYSFDELSEAAKRTAIDELRPQENVWSEENFNSIKKLIEIMPCSVNWRNQIVSVGGEVSELSGQRLATYIWNNYRNDLYKPKQYWICEGRPNTVGVNSKHRDSKLFLYDELGCNLTGYCMDNSVLAPIFDFMRKPSKHTTLEDILNECISAYEKACEQDWEFQNSDEQIIETIKVNEYTFTETGKLENL